MATIKPFAALRPKPELAERICEWPYDVVSSAEAGEIALGNPMSFLRISKPEIELPAATDPYDPQVYEKGRRNFEKWISEGWLVRESQPAFYLYRQIMGDHRQVGLVAVASCEEYRRGIIKKHELTRIDKENDRVRHIEALHAQTGPVFLTYRAVPKLRDLFARKTAEPPDVDFTAKDGVRHSAWTFRGQADLDLLEKEFAEIPSLYIADGHHRSAAAARVYETRKGKGHSPYFLAVIFPHDEMQILPYNRVLKDLNGLTVEALLDKLSAVFVMGSEGASKPARVHEVCLFLDGKWRTLNFRSKFVAATDPIEKLDVTLLQKNIFDPIWGITDPRTSKRLHFVGGIRGTGELERLVNSEKYACAFSMFPTSIDDLMAIADAGAIMPPKSTWFEPKLRDAMFCHLL